VVRVPSYRSRGPAFDSGRYQIFRKLVGLKRDPFSLLRITEKLLKWKDSGSGLENRDLPPWESVALTTRYHISAKVGTTFATSDGRTVVIVRLWANVMGYFFFNLALYLVTHYVMKRHG
jgi:hypothetical protein